MQAVVLLVEDDNDLRKAISLALEPEGYLVLEATDGQSGWELLQRMPRPDVVITDLSMAPVNGREFLRRKEADPEYRTIPVMIFTGEADVSDLSRYLVFRKPFELKRLVGSLARMSSTKPFFAPKDG
ncbi:MAG: PleD family two-component system response regulator [Bacteriovoracia bacterium]